MSKTILLFVTSLQLISFQGIGQENIDTWNEAKWIAFEHLQDELTEAQKCITAIKTDANT